MRAKNKNSCTLQNFGKDPQPVAEDPNDKKKKQLPEDKNKKTKKKK
jgi:hypothetical protein